MSRFEANRGAHQNRSACGATLVKIADKFKVDKLSKATRCAGGWDLRAPTSAILASEGLGVLGAQQWRWTGWAWLSVLRGSPRSKISAQSGWWRLRDRSLSAVAGTLQLVSGGTDGGPRWIDAPVLGLYGLWAPPGHSTILVLKGLQGGDVKALRLR